MNRNDLKPILEGAGIGLVTGIVIGLSEAEWLRLVLTLTLLTYTTKTIKFNKSKTIDDSFRIGFIGIFAFLGILLGLFIHKQQFLKPTPAQEIAKLMKAGHSKEKSKELWTSNFFISKSTSSLDSTQSKILIEQFSKLIKANETEKSDSVQEIQ